MSRPRSNYPVLLWLCLSVLPLAACRSATSAELDGQWTLSGADVLGSIDATGGGGCAQRSLNVTLYGPAMSTDGSVAAHAVQEEPGLFWLDFPVHTAVGEGQAAMRLQGHEALLPLGARAGELELRLDAQPGLPSTDALDLARASAQASVAARLTAWEDGVFRLQDEDGRLVGDVSLYPDRAPQVAVYDETWWSGGPVEADRLDDGPDIVLSFPVEPALRGEEGQLRLNVPLSLAVVPADYRPTELDRVLRLIPGQVSDADRAEAMALARQRADAAELDAMVSLGQLLAARARTPQGTCKTWQQVSPQLVDILVGYEVLIVADGDDCLVDVQPVVAQHRRRLRARIDSHGLVTGPVTGPGSKPN